MANIVILGGKKYLVDVGYGVDGPICPLVLQPGCRTTGLSYQNLRCEPRTLPQHTDPLQKVWVYMQHRGEGPWQDVYHFADTEVLPQDFDVLNFYNMTNSLWARTVVAQHFLPSDDGDVVGTRMLVGKELRMGNGSSSEHIVVERYKTEEERLIALRRYFGIVLSDEETNAIIGRPTALTGSDP
jgi:arylamine N-acetyltransferase